MDRYSAAEGVATLFALFRESTIRLAGTAHSRHNRLDRPIEPIHSGLVEDVDRVGSRIPQIREELGEVVSREAINIAEHSPIDVNGVQRCYSQSAEHFNKSNDLSSARALTPDTAVWRAHNVRKHHRIVLRVQPRVAPPIRARRARAVSGATGSYTESVYQVITQEVDLLDRVHLRSCSVVRF